MFNDMDIIDVAVERFDNEGNPKYRTLAESNGDIESWGDDVRMNFLLDPFRVRDVNPLGYDRKMEFWKKAVKLYCELNNRCTFKHDDLTRFYTRKDKRPYCLATVFSDMRKEKVAMTLPEFLAMQPTRSFMDTVKNLPFEFYYKVMNNLGYTNEDDSILTDNTVQFIHMGVVESMAERLVSKIKEDIETGMVFTYEELHEKTQMNMCTIKLIVHWLSLNRRANVTTMKNTKESAIKISLPGKQVEPVTDNEIAVLELQQNEKHLKKDMEELETQKLEVHKAAREYLNNEKRQLAKVTLKKEKDIDELIKKKAKMLMNVQNTLFVMQNTKSNAKVLDVYRQVADVMKKNAAEKGLNFEKVDETMADIGDILEEHSEIQKRMTEPVREEPEEDYEKELAELLLLEDSQPPPPPPGGDYKFDIKDLPSVPNAPPESVEDFPLGTVRLVPRKQ